MDDLEGHDDIIRIGVEVEGETDGYVADTGGEDAETE